MNHIYLNDLSFGSFKKTRIKMNIYLKITVFHIKRNCIFLQVKICKTKAVQLVKINIQFLRGNLPYNFPHNYQHFPFDQMHECDKIFSII